MSSEAHLIDTSFFRWAILTPVILGAVLMIIAALNSGERLNFCLEAACFNNFFGLFKFQFAVMGLAIPLGALVASHHRSVQSADQIKTQLSQNIFSNHIDHKSLFEKFFRDNDPLNLGEVSNRQIWDVYERVFPGAPYGDLTPSDQLESYLNDTAEQFSEIARKVLIELKPTALDLSESHLPTSIININATTTAMFGIPRPTDGRAINRDPVTQIKNFVEFTVSVLGGLELCANFHRFYQQYAASHSFHKEYYEVKDHLAELQSTNDARLKILNALENASDKNGNIAKNDEYASRSLSHRLNEFTNDSNSQDFITAKDMRIVYEHYIPNTHKKIFLDHIPVSWQMELSGDLIRS